MDDVNDDAKGGGHRKIEVLTGPGRRRRWSDEQKSQIVAETLEPGAVVTEIARRWQVCPQQVFGWRHEMRLGRLADRWRRWTSCRSYRPCPHQNRLPRRHRPCRRSR